MTLWTISIWLGDPAYRHVLLNHVPIIGLFVAFLVLSTGPVLRQTAVLFIGLVLVALTAGASIPVANYGDAAYPVIYDRLDGAGQKWLRSPCGTCRDPGCRY
ncbi:MAG: hypothetical protein IPG06_25725 [Haliea sp.]|nr:hypothetical protein [Haliea sp.]